MKIVFINFTPWFLSWSHFFQKNTKLLSKKFQNLFQFGNIWGCKLSISNFMQLIFWFSRFVSSILNLYRESDLSSVWPIKTIKTRVFAQTCQNLYWGSCGWSTYIWRTITVTSFDNWLYLSRTRTHKCGSKNTRKLFWN